MVTLEIEGVNVEINAPNPETKLDKDTLGLVSFKCTCGAKVKIDKDKVRNPLPIFAVPPSNGFNDVKTAMETSKKWNMFPKGLSEYFAHERASLVEGGTDRYGTSINVHCDTCRREYNLPITMTNPVKRKPVPTAIEAWKTFDHKTDLSKTALTRVAVRNQFGTADELADHIDKLISDSGKVTIMLEGLKKTVNGINGVSTGISKRFINSLSDSLKEISEDFHKQNDEALKQVLGDIRENSSIAPAGHGEGEGFVPGTK